MRRSPWLALPILLLTGALTFADSPSISRGPIDVSFDCPEPNRCSAQIAAKSLRDFRVDRADNPPRIVVDLFGPVLPKGGGEIIQGNPVVSKIRFGIQPKASRVVFDLLPGIAPACSVKRNPDSSLTIFFNTPADTEDRPRRAGPTKAATPTPASAPIPAPAEATPTPRPAPTEPIKPSPTETVVSRPTEIQTTPTARPSLAPPSIIGLARPTPPATRPAPSTETAVGSLHDLPLSPEALAQQADLRFSVDKLLLTFRSPGPAAQNMTVKNTSERTLYMTASMVELRKVEGRQDTAQPTTAMLVSPRNFELQPGAQRTIRIVRTIPAGAGEQTFQLRLSPAPDPFDETLQLQIEGKASRINVVTALGVLVLNQPTDPRVILDISRTDDRIEIRNDGNVSFLMSEIRICTGATECRDFTSRRVFAGNTLAIKAPPSAEMRFIKRVGDDYEVVRIPPGS